MPTQISLIDSFNQLLFDFFFLIMLNIQSYSFRGTKIRPSPVWLAFDVNPTQKEGICRFCLKSITITQKGPSSNLKRHLHKDKRHAEWYAEICKSSNPPPVNTINQTNNLHTQAMPMVELSTANYELQLPFEPNIKLEPLD